jgi:hypothetical protein
LGKQAIVEHRPGDVLRVHDDVGRLDPPSIPIAIVIIAAAGALAAVAMVVIRHVVAGPLLADPGRGASMVAVVGTAFAILLAFIIVDAFQTYSGADAAADSEATKTLEMFRTAALFAAGERDAVRSDLACYGRAVAYSEWPAMRDGESSPLVVPWINRWNRAVKRLDLRTPQARQALTQFTIEDDARTDAGVARFRKADTPVPAPLWFVLVIGAVLAVALQLTMTDPRERLRIHAAMVGAVAAILTAGLLLVAYLDHPYSGRPGSIEPDAMEFTLTAMQGIDQHLDPPCDAVGRPVERS